jgi:hypothetical protein
LAIWPPGIVHPWIKEMTGMIVVSDQNGLVTCWKSLFLICARCEEQKCLGTSNDLTANHPDYEWRLTSTESSSVEK